MSAEAGEQKRGKSEIKLPEFAASRLKLWDELEAKQNDAAKSAPKKPITVTLPDGKQFDGISNETSPLDIAKSLNLPDKFVACKVDGKVTDIWRPLTNSCKLHLLDFDSPEGSNVFWHSSAHILGQALELVYQDARLCIGPALPDGGFYYDVHLAQDKKVSPSDFKQIEEVIKKIVDKEKQPFRRLVLTKEQALEMFKYNQFKTELIKSKVPDGASCTAYRCGPLIDLCKGPHIANTGKVKAIEVTKNSSAYWLGKAENPSLQRVYGMSFPDKARLKEWRKFMEEAEKRDHRKVGPSQELFFFHDLSPGAAFFLPHGARIYNKLMNFIRTEYRKRGYQEVVTPNVFNLDLWKISGHYANYKENMFTFKAEEQEFGMKPMNCPGHCLMFKHRLRSYRELPLRLADFGVLHRNELSGALSGLTRVRRFQQDDAHIFCRHDQIEEEVSSVLDMLQSVYGVLGFHFDLQLSTRPAKFLGEIKMWDEAERALAKCLTNFCTKLGKEWTINYADGAFYGPKIDIQLTDALKRKHQCATIQLDFQLPLRFELKFKSSDEGFVPPVIIHRAILGSVERMFAVLLEHTAGKWPFWLSPRQVIILPVSEKTNEYSQAVYKAFHDAGYYVDIDLTANKVAKKVRDAQIAQYNLMLVVGPEEASQGSVNVRYRDSDKQDPMPLQACLEMCAKLTESKQ